MSFFTVAAGGSGVCLASRGAAVVLLAHSSNILEINLEHPSHAGSTHSHNRIPRITIKTTATVPGFPSDDDDDDDDESALTVGGVVGVEAVSYTHLTLPTKA